MDIKELFQKAFNIDLPISGGMGDSITNAIKIHQDGILNDYIQTEYSVMRYIAMGREIQWKLIQQDLIIHETKTIDRLTIEVKGLGNNTVALHHEFIYFDITEVSFKNLNL